MDPTDAISVLPIEVACCVVVSRKMRDPRLAPWEPERCRRKPTYRFDDRFWCTAHAPREAKGLGDPRVPLMPFHRERDMIICTGCWRQQWLCCCMGAAEKLPPLTARPKR